MLAIRRAAGRIRRGRYGLSFSEWFGFFERRRGELEEFDAEQLLRFGHGAVCCVVCPGDSDSCTGAAFGQEGLLMIALGERCTAKACK
jgi:hypothetical protein